MSELLRILQVEDSESDAAYVLRMLQRAGYDIHAARVETPEQLRAALLREPWDAVLSDYRLPGFDAPAALRVLHDTRLDLPFIVISGTVGEDTAVEVMKSGAHDYLMKGNLTRLVQTVEREIREARIRTARRMAEEALRESNERLRLALSSARMGVWELNLVSGRIYWSPECYRALPHEVFKETAEAFFETVHPEDRARLRAEMDAAIAAHYGFTPEFRVQTAAGEARVLANFGQAEYGADGAALRLTGTVQDITEQRRSEAALQRSEAMLQSVVDSALDGLIVIDGRGAVELWNPAAARMFGYTAEEAIGKTLHGLIAPGRLRAGYDEGFADFVRSGTGPVIGRTQELIAARKDGTEFPVELSVAPVTYSGSRYAMGVVRDITERKRTEEALRESERRWQFALEGSGDGVWDADAHTRTAFCSRQWQAMIGLDENEFSGQLADFEALIHPEDRDNVMAVLTGLFEGASQRFTAEYRMRCKDGSYKWILDRAKVVAHDENGKPARVIGTHTDLTGIKAAEAEREKLRAQFLQAQKMESIGRLAGGVAHDFNNLLTVINGYSGLAMSLLAPEDSLYEPIEEIHRAGERATGLVRQLLAFSRNQVLKEEYLDLNLLIADIQRMLHRLVREDIEVVTRLTPSLHAVLADRHQLEQAVMNLVVNARDAMPDGGTLTIETGEEPQQPDGQPLGPDARPGPYVRLTIRDTGGGIDERVRQHIFEPFFTTKEVGRGTGLGLATVQGIVLQSGGHLTFDTAVGEGTAFHIYLPAVERISANDAAPAAGATAASGHETILLVDDQADVRRFCARVLEKRGYRVLQAANGEGALALLSAGPADLLVTDLVMPRMNGRELAGRARQLQPRLRVLFISGYSTDAASDYRETLADEPLMQKPFDAQSLAAKVREVLGNPHYAARIVVIDEDSAIRRFVRSVLEGERYYVLEAASGRQALQTIAAAGADLAIVDTAMPLDTAAETIQTLRREHPTMRIVAVARAGELQMEGFCQRMAADAAIPKPIEPAVLLAEVAAALKR